MKENAKLLARSKSDMKYPGHAHSAQPGSAFGPTDSPQPYGKRATLPGLPMQRSVRVEPFFSERGRDALGSHEAAQRALKLKGTRSGSETNVGSKNC